MKLFKNITLLAIVFVTLASCDLADPIESQVTEYAEFEVTGGQYLYVQEGTTFEDPGVVAIAGEDELEVEVSGTVDTDTPGVYVLTYSAINEDGFPAETTRFVAVGDTEVAHNRDLSGVYSVGTATNTVSEIVPGFYQNSDVLPPNGINVFMVDLGNGDLIIPPQSSRFGEVYADPTLNPDSFAALNEDATEFTIHKFIGCCGIFARDFIKQ